MSGDDHLQRSMFEQALNAMPDGVLITDAARRVVYHNAAFGQQWAIPAEILASRDERRLIDCVLSKLVDPAGFVAEIDRIHPTVESCQDEIAFTDGTILSRRSVPFSIHGSFAARLWIFTDVTEARHACVDALCGIPNRRAFALHYPSFAESPDDGTLKAVGLIDVDHFKIYNDRHGHAEGDAVLRRIGALLRDRLSQHDTRAFRIGGEEFMIMRRCNSRSEATRYFDGIRADVADLALRHEGNQPHAHVTISIGLGTLRGPEESSSLFDRVDAALYRAKAKGRNRIEIAEMDTTSARSSRGRHTGSNSTGPDAV